MQCSSSGIHPTSLGLVVVALLLAATSQLLAAKAVSGRQSQLAEGSVISATANGDTFSYPLQTGNSAPFARNKLVGIINGDPGNEYKAGAEAVPPPGVFESDDVAYYVLNQDNSELNSLEACEDDGNYTVSGVYFSGSRSVALIRSPPAVGGADGELDLRLEPRFGPTVHVEIPTDLVPDVKAALTTALVNLGFTVQTVGQNLRITKSGVFFRGVRLESTDSGITDTCAKLEGSVPPPPSGFPAISQNGLALLVAGLLLAGVLMIWRKSRPGASREA